MTQDRQVLIFENPYNLSNYLVKKWTEIAQQSISQGGRFLSAISVSKDQVEFYSRLSGLKDFDLWKKSRIFFTDERFVKKTSVETNYKILKEYLLNDVDIPDENIYPIITDTHDVSIALGRYENKLYEFFKIKPGQIPVFDLVLLGVGKNGETASIYPLHWGADEEEKIVMTVEIEDIDYPMISLTLPVLRNAKNVIFVVTGNDRSDIVRAIVQDKRQFPASMINPREGKVLYCLDKKAASKLSYGDSFSHDGQAVSVWF